ncbi:hypothetical protein EKH55_4719 [Sinorhizobium alkalisoli]|nr:hypothetical protein EKH55_4719 [Sinorhizobium alkalisoli]
MDTLNLLLSGAGVKGGAGRWNSAFASHRTGRSVLIVPSLAHVSY